MESGIEYSNSTRQTKRARFVTLSQLWRIYIKPAAVKDILHYFQAFIEASPVVAIRIENRSHFVDLESLKTQDRISQVTAVYYCTDYKMENRYKYNIHSKSESSPVHFFFKSFWSLVIKTEQITTCEEGTWVIRDVDLFQTRVCKRWKSWNFQIWRAWPYAIEIFLVVWKLAL